MFKAGSRLNNNFQLTTIVCEFKQAKAIDQAGVFTTKRLKKSSSHQLAWMIGIYDGAVVSQALVEAMDEGVVAVHVGNLDAGEGTQEALQVKNV